MTQDELEDELFVAMLARSREGEGPIFDLQALCREFAIDANPLQLLAFITQNDGVFGSKTHVTTKDIKFEIYSEGLRHAKQIEKPIIPAEHPSINIQNTFSPINKAHPGPAPATKRSDLADWANLAVALLIGLASIAVTLWIAGKL